MPDQGQLNVNDRVLIHLSRHATDTPPQEHPAETSQAGIASAVGISRTHVPRAVKSLMRDGLVEELRARVAGHERRMSVYSITPEGMRRAGLLWQRLMNAPFTLRTAGRTEQVKGKDLEERVGRKRAQALVARARDGIVEMEDRRKTAIKDLDEAPSIHQFFDRDQEFGVIKAFMESETDVLVLLGNRGYGTSSLARAFLDGQEEYNILWISLEMHPDPEALKERLLRFARRFEPDVSDPFGAFRIADSVIVFDGYYSVDEDTVEFFASMIDHIEEAKVVITAREDTPAYNWFYHKKQVDSGKVQELRLKGLDQAGALRMLGRPGMDQDALKRIHMMTRGQPMALGLLRDGDYEGLKKNTVFTAEEIRYLLFLRDKTG